ncbi:MAG: type II toxin-antitoxin system RelE/ParE family toxin [Caldilineaceae bacterium]
MSRSYAIRYLRTAQQDLVEIFDYIARDDATAATALLETFDQSIARLATHPFLGSVPKDERLHRLGYRMLVVGKYLIFYVVKQETVQIRRVLHSSRQYQFLL